MVTPTPASAETVTLWARNLQPPPSEHPRKAPFDGRYLPQVRPAFAEILEGIKRLPKSQQARPLAALINNINQWPASSQKNTEIGSCTVAFHQLGIEHQNAALHSAVMSTLSGTISMICNNGSMFGISLAHRIQILNGNLYDLPASLHLTVVTLMREDAVSVQEPRHVTLLDLTPEDCIYMHSHMPEIRQLYPVAHINETQALITKIEEGTGIPDELRDELPKLRTAVQVAQTILGS
jgi:hypothetical protein